MDDIFDQLVIFFGSYLVSQKREDRFFSSNLVFANQILFSKKAIESRKVEENCFLSLSIKFFSGSYLVSQNLKIDFSL